jgi:hypothetical protein
MKLIDLTIALVTLATVFRRIFAKEIVMQESSVRERGNKN